MNRKVQRRLAAIGAFLVLLVPSQLNGQILKEWTWKDAGGEARTRAELEEILAEHKLWLASKQSRGTQADLTGANLMDADLDKAELSRAKLLNADLRKAHLREAHLNGALLLEANLAGANLSKASLTEAALFKANLSNADLTRANLDKAGLIGTNLKGALLTETSLSHALLFEADLSGARLFFVDLKDTTLSLPDVLGTVFEPNSLSEIRGIALAKHLEFVTYASSPDALVQLRKQFEENGFRTQERKITYALNRRKAELDGPFERWFQRVAFDLTCQYGMNPGRALKIWLALLLFCWLVYAVSIHVPGESGIYRIQKAAAPTGKDDIEEQIRPSMISPLPMWRYPIRWISQELRVFFWAGFFSLMSAFNIGFRDINFGRWLRLLPRTEYDLKAKGWARSVAGFQSLISVYLIALWVLTYFGRPFE